MNSKFYDRHQAGLFLAEQLAQLTWDQPGWVLALPRGGVPIAAEVADRLNWPLEILLVRKLGVPDQPELAMGAIALPQAQVLNRALIQQLKISPAQIQAVQRAETQELDRRNQYYRQGRGFPTLENQPVIIVDDGLATGATMQAAIAALRQLHPANITVAIPVAAASSLAQLQPLVDRTVCLTAPEAMGSISQWYVHFEAVTDQTVIDLLQKYSPPPADAPSQ